MDRRTFGKLVMGSVALGGIGCEPVHGPGAVSGPPVGGRSRVQRTVRTVIESQRTLEGAGFPVRRPFPTRPLAMVDPFVLLDEMGPVRWGPGEARGAPDHPHRGFETVTYVLVGETTHRDSLGNRGRLQPGDVQWMTAGSGIVHAEMPAQAIMATGGDLHAFQLWVNLPARNKRVAPGYQYLGTGGGGMPLGGTDDDRVHARVIAGEALGVRAQLATHTPMVYQHWTLRPGGGVSHRVPRDHAACVYVFRGGCRLGEEARAVREGDLAILGDGDVVRMSVPADAPGPAELLFLGGVPLREPVARGGPFVMNTDEEVAQAFADYRSGRMGSIPG